MADSELKERTAKGLFWGGLSNLWQLLLNVAFGIYLARVLSPEDYGLMAMIAIYCVLAQVLQEGGFVPALINRKQIVAEDYNAVFWFNLMISVVCYLVLFIFAPLIARFNHHPELTSLCRWNFLGFILIGLGTSQKAFLMKKLMVREMAIVNLIAIIVSGTVAIVLAYWGFGYWALAVQGLILGGLTSAGYWFCSTWKPSFQFRFQPIREMISFSIKMLVTGLVGNMTATLMQTFLGRYSTADQAGFYNNSNKWNSIGTTLLNGMINSVAQPVLAEVVDEKQRQLRVFRKMIRFAAFLSFPAMLGLAFIAPEFIEVTITDKWAESIVLLQVLCIGGSLLPMVSLCCGLIDSRGKAGIHMWINITFFLLTLAVIFLLYPFGIVRMVIGLSALNLLLLLVWTAFVCRETGYSYGKLAIDLIPFLGSAVASIATTWFLTQGIGNIYLRLVAKIAVTAALYFGVMRLSGAIIFKESMQFIVSKLKRHE